MRGVEGQLDILGSASGHLGERPASHRRRILEVLAVDRRDPFTADVVLVTAGVFRRAARLARRCVNSHCFLLNGAARIRLAMPGPRALNVGTPPSAGECRRPETARLTCPNWPNGEVATGRVGSAV